MFWREGTRLPRAGYSGCPRHQGIPHLEPFGRKRLNHCPNGSFDENGPLKRQVFERPQRSIFGLMRRQREAALPLMKESLSNIGATSAETRAFAAGEASSALARQWKKRPHRRLQPRFHGAEAVLAAGKAPARVPARCAARPTGGRAVHDAKSLIGNVERAS
jgi:hypothetical protein